MRSRFQDSYLFMFFLCSLARQDFAGVNIKISARFSSFFIFKGSTILQKLLYSLTVSLLPQRMLLVKQIDLGLAIIQCGGKHFKRVFKIEYFLQQNKGQINIIQILINKERQQFFLQNLKERQYFLFFLEREQKNIEIILIYNLILVTTDQSMLPQVHYYCSNPEHQEEHASYFCKKQQCIQNNPICVLCACGPHKDHNPQPIKILLKRIQQDSNAYQQNLSIFAKIDVLKQKLYDLCKKIADPETRKTIESSMDHYFTIILSKIQLEQIQFLNAQIKKSVNRFSEKQTQQEIFNSIIKYQKRLNLGQGQTQHKQKSNYVRALKNVLQNLQDSAAGFQQSIKKGQVDLSIIQIFSPDSKKSFHFNSKNKHLKLQLIGDKIIKMPQQYASMNYLALIHPKLSTQKVQTITLQMVSLTSYITIGICKKDKISGNFQFNSSQSNHGTFQISFDGYAWCEGNSSLNEQYTGWYFNQGDKVSIQFNPKSKKLKFYKNQDESNQYQMPIQFVKSDKLYFCVSLNSRPEEIHIID